MPFHLDVPAAEGTLNVAVHGEGRVRRGDLVSTAAIPPSPHVVVPVEPV